MTNTNPENLGNIIPNADVRGYIYAAYSGAGIVIGAANAYYLAVTHNDPQWLLGAAAILGYLTLPMAGLALANKTPKGKVMTQIDGTGRVIGDPDAAVEPTTSIVIDGVNYVKDGDNFVPAPEAEAEPEATPQEPTLINGQWYVFNPITGGYDHTDAPAETGVNP